ncbi:unnamed protein product [Moneuplotes crassus]|uniref:Uncharacterized protein n=1 Tax=Euplotes crassus TaxID=5936 RepID=A0AAD1UD48_EUPCR|nr:unnamed protein product [Moneuplotes crassus]
MESSSELYTEEMKSSTYNFDFKNASIRINFFQDFFIYVDFKQKTRCKIHLSQFKFNSEEDEVALKKKYKLEIGKKIESGALKIEPFHKVFFAPIDEFKDTDQIVHIAPHFVYLIRGHISTSTKVNAMAYARGGSLPKIYKFDFSKFEYKLVFTFNHDLYGFTATRYSLSQDSIIELVSPFSRDEMNGSGYRGFLVLGGKGIKVPRESENSFLKRYYFYITHDGKGEHLDSMYIIKSKAMYVKSDSISITHRINNLDYVICHAGSRKKDNSESKEMEMTSSFDTLFYHIDKAAMCFGTPQIDQCSFWNSTKYAMIPTGDFIYFLGGRSLVEAEDLNNERLNIRKLKIIMDPDQPLNIHSITETEDFHPVRKSETLLFNEESHSDLCYLNYNDNTKPLETIYGLFTTYSDPHELYVLEYDTEKEKPVIKNLRVDYRPFKHKTKVVKYFIYFMYWFG